jgi:hypothetical protein
VSGEDSPSGKQDETMATLNDVLRFGIREGNDRQLIEQFARDLGWGCTAAEVEFAADQVLGELLDGVVDDDGAPVDRDSLDEETVRVLAGELSARALAST